MTTVQRVVINNCAKFSCIPPIMANAIGSPSIPPCTADCGLPPLATFMLAE
ncbi:hypothetical protein [Bacillus salipaludis]|uniref:hypothetical protein n=1 Tax=Bacillus salipaludis TaxID=2547811 RepID=UPI001404989A|nr:hypothetical protein [Bacillus salipaludis]